MKCQYCLKDAEFVDSAEIYHGISYGMVYLCRGCDAYCGVHKGTDKPMGSLANKELRELRKECHALFDNRWKVKLIGNAESKSKIRNAEYQWLADKLGITKEECHFSQMSLELMKQSLQLLKDSHE